VQPEQSSLSSDLSSALVAALAWAAIDAVRAHGELPLGSVFAALLGSTSLLLGVLVVAFRRALPLGEVARAFVFGALVAVSPLAAIAAVLQKVTHHRALGGVTFAFVALFVAFASVACAARLLQIARIGGPHASVARRALWGAIALSCAGVVVVLALGLRSKAAAPVVAVVVDAALGVAVCALALALRLRSPAAVRLGAALWIGALVVGIVATTSAAPLRQLLTERVPVAFALGWGG
jgi:hypothetical protein